MLEYVDLSAGYAKRDVISGISLSLIPGKITGLIGPNGAGKSTLLRAAVGLCEIHSGEILLDNVPTKNLSPVEIARRVSYLPQEHPAPALTVRRLILHGRFPHLGYPRHYSKKDIELCETVMRRLDLSDLRDTYVAELSGGQRQKVYLAMAMVVGSETLLLDEPTASLDIRHTNDLAHLLRNLADEGRAVAMVVHNLDYAFRVCDRIAVLDKGSLTCVLTPEELLASGHIESVFGVRASRLLDEDGYAHYFFRSIETGRPDRA